jgi:hypothetical protein
MTDLELLALVQNQLSAAQVAAGYNYVIIKAAQPTQQGTPSASSITFKKKWDIAYGFPQTSESFDSVNNIFTEITTQYVESYFEIGAFINEIPGEYSPTGSDVIGMLQLYLSSAANLRILSANSAGMLRIRELTNLYYDNDKSQYQALPTFEWVITHQKVINNTAPFTSTVTGTIMDVSRSSLNANAN